MVFLDMCSKALLPFSCTAEEIIDFGIRRIFRALRANLRRSWCVALHAPTLHSMLGCNALSRSFLLLCRS